MQYQKYVPSLKRMSPIHLYSCYMYIRYPLFLSPLKHNSSVYIRKFDTAIRTKIDEQNQKPYRHTMPYTNSFFIAMINHL